VVRIDNVSTSSTTTNHKMGIENPRGIKNTMSIAENKIKNLWQAAAEAVPKQFTYYETFIILDSGEGNFTEYWKVPHCIAVDVNYDLGYKERMIGRERESLKINEGTTADKTSHHEISSTYLDDSIIWNKESTGNVQFLVQSYLLKSIDTPEHWFRGNCKIKDVSWIFADTYHRVCKAVLVEVMRFTYEKSEDNDCEILTESLSSQRFHDFVKEWLFRVAEIQK